MRPSSFQVSPEDNVATLLDDAAQGVEVAVIGGGSAQVLVANEQISRGHKVALRDLASGEPVLKYGVSIGQATAPIQRGDWVHLHNCKSHLDERSSSLDRDTGAPLDVIYE